MKTLTKNILLFIALLMTTIITEAQEKTKGQYAKVNGLNMYYEIHGTGSPLVLIHGGGSTIYTTFGNTLASFAKHRKVIAVELQAHGHTADRNTPTSFEQDADDVAALLEQLHITKAAILGFSNGASTAYQVAIRHPQLVDKIVAIASMSKRSDMQPWFWPMMEKGTFADMPQIYKDEYLKITHSEEGLHAMYKRDSDRMLGFKDWDDAGLKSIKAPTLIINGDQDVITVEGALAQQRLIANSRLAILPGIHGEYLGEIMTQKPGSKMPEVLVTMVEEFLSSK